MADNYSTVSSYLFFTPIFSHFFPNKGEKTIKKSSSLFFIKKLCARARRELYEAHKTRPLCSRAISTPVVIKKRFGSESRDVLIMCLGNSGPVQAMGAMANGKTNRQTTMTTRRKRVNFDGGGEDEDASSNDEEEEEKERDGITLEDLHACVLDSECAAAKKFGCGTTRFKTMYALSNLLIVLLAFLSTFFFHIGCEMVKRHGTSSRDSRSLSLLPTHLSLSVCVQMSQTRHRAMAAPEITLAPGNVQELSRILQGRKRNTSDIAFWSFDFFFYPTTRCDFYYYE